jgi:hypothetical protein
MALVTTLNQDWPNLPLEELQLLGRKRRSFLRLSDSRPQAAAKPCKDSGVSERKPQWAVFQKASRKPMHDSIRWEGGGRATSRASTPIRLVG